MKVSIPILPCCFLFLSKKTKKWNDYSENLDKDKTKRKQKYTKAHHTGIIIDNGLCIFKKGIIQEVLIKYALYCITM